MTKLVFAFRNFANAPDKTHFLRRLTYYTAVCTILVAKRKISGFGNDKERLCNTTCNKFISEQFVCPMFHPNETMINVFYKLQRAKLRKLSA
jgi:hypothetical protein